MRQRLSGPLHVHALWTGLFQPRSRRARPKRLRLLPRGEEFRHPRPRVRERLPVLRGGPLRGGRRRRLRPVRCRAQRCGAGQRKLRGLPARPLCWHPGARRVQGVRHRVLLGTAWGHFLLILPRWKEHVLAAERLAGGLSVRSRLAAVGCRLLRGVLRYRCHLPRWCGADGGARSARLLPARRGDGAGRRWACGSPCARTRAVPVRVDRRLPRFHAAQRVPTRSHWARVRRVCGRLFARERGVRALQRERSPRGSGHGGGCHPVPERLRGVPVGWPESVPDSP
mmetsp:Transcript_39705/g.90294  ORF Transcript_39705/g.90294 Transcript_39705/m.90294 type:complete len:283 (-) Transcript_39705:1266-2114(-)